LTLLAGALVALPALAHKPSDSYLTLTVSGARVAGRWDIALRDLDNALSLDRDGGGAITWVEVRSRGDDIADYALARLTLDADGAHCPTAFKELGVTTHSDGTYAVVAFAAACPAEPRVLGVDYRLFFDIDPQHDGIVRLDDGAGTRTAIFTARTRTQRFEATRLAPARQLGAAVELGVRHIFSGIDHLLFLLALLLPAVLRRRGLGRWEPVADRRAAVVDVLKIVSSFTLAHSITLTLATLDLLRLPSGLVESGIAASVVVAAVNNVVPILDDDRWAAAFALGLLHGFGFSATLMDLGLPRRNLVLTLFGFNAGVEIGQLCVVATFLPLAMSARRTRVYRGPALVGASVVVAGVASVWFVERAFAVKVF
jgi:hypothetical protein